jgi:hypothetical protein
MLCRLYGHAATEEARVVGWEVLIVRLSRGAAAGSWSLDHAVRAPLGKAGAIRNALGSVFGDAEWSPPHKGLFDHEGYSVEASIGIWDDVDSMTLDFWRGGDPLPALRELCRENGWNAWDLDLWQPVDLEAPAAPGWQRYRHSQRRA